MIRRPGTDLLLPDEEEALPPPPPPSEFARLSDEVRAAKFDDAPPSPPPLVPATSPRPAGFGAGLGDAALRQAQDNAGTMASRGVMYDAFKGIGDSLLRHRAPREDGVAKALTASGQADVQNIEQRRAGMGQELDLQGKQAAQAASEADNDPTSKSSTDARAFIGSLFPKLAPSIEGMSRAQIHEAYPILEKALAQHDAKAKAGLSAEQEARVDEEIRKIDPNVNVNGLPYEVKVKILDSKLRSAGQEQTRHHQSVSEGQVGEGLALRGTTITNKARAQEFHQSQSDVPGTEDIDPAHPKAISAGHAETLQNQKAALDAGRDGVAFIKSTLAKYGRRIANPLDQEAQVALSQARSRLIDILPQLGQANGFGTPTQGMIELQHASEGGDPTSLRNLFNPDRLPGTLDSVINTATDRYHLSLKAAGKKAAAPGHMPARSHFSPTIPGEPVSSLDSPESSEDAKAEKWARANPDNPMSAAILQKLGQAP